MSKLFSLNSTDVIKALVLAVLTPVVGYVLTVLQSGSFGVDWHQVLLLALSGGIGYIVKNYFSDAQGNPLGIGSV